MKIELTDVEQKAMNDALYVFNQCEKSKHRYPNKTNSLSNHLTGSTSFVERIIGDATMKIDQILGPDIQKAAEAGLDKVRLSSLDFTNLAIEHEHDKTTIRSLFMSADGKPVCQMVWDLKKKNDETKITFTISESPADNPTYKYANRLSITHIDRPGSEEQSMPHAHAWINNFAKFVDVMDHLRGPLEYSIGFVNFGPEFMNLGISHHQLEMKQYYAIVDQDGGLPGDLCRIAGKYMTDTAYSNLFKQTAIEAPELIAILKEKNVTYGESYFTFHDGNNNVTVASCAETGEDALIMEQEGNVTILAIKNDAEGKPSLISAYQCDAGPEAFEMIDGWIAGERDDRAATASFDFSKDGLEAITVSDAFVANSGGNAIGLDVHYGLKSIPMIGKRGDYAISTNFNDFLLQIDSDYGYNEAFDL